MTSLPPGNTELPHPDTASTAAEMDNGACGASSPSESMARGATVEVSAASIRGAANVQGNQFINFYGREGQEGSHPAPPWEDELHEVRRLPEPAHALDKEEAEHRTQALRASRLLLLRHSPSRQQDAEAGMQGVLHALRQREPERKAFAGSDDAEIQLRKLARGGWREDRRGSVIYLYRSGDPAVLNFFNNIEQVDALCARLAEMDCYLLLTVSTTGTATLKCEHELGKHIGLWSFESDRQADSDQFGQILAGRFELTLASCAALFPGLGAGEFTSLVKLLTAPAATQAGTAPPSAAAPPTRQERWRVGERDLVLAELGLRMQMPPQAEDTSEAAHAGIFFADAARRAEIPTWLYERHPFLLSEQLEALTAHYLTPQASRRFGIGYRRFVQQLDTIGVRPLSAAWLIRQAQAALDGAAPFMVMQRVVDLVSSLPEQHNKEQLICDLLGGVASMIVLEESHLQEQLQERGLHAAPGEEAISDPFGFWRGLHDMQAARKLIERAAQRQAILIALFMDVPLGTPETVAKTLGDAVSECDAGHRQWLRAAGLERPRQPSRSLAGMTCRDYRSLLLRHDPPQWLALAAGVAQVRHLPVQTRRWLAWDCLYSLAASLEDLPDSLWPAAVYDALIGNDSGRRIGQVLAPLLLSTQPRPGVALVVDAESTLWIYQLLMLATMMHEPGDPACAGQVAAALIGPLHEAFGAAWRMALVDLAGTMLDREMDTRDCAANRGKRNLATQRIKSLQLVVRMLRSRAPQSSH